MSTELLPEIRIEEAAFPFLCASCDEEASAQVVVGWSLPDKKQHFVRDIFMCRACLANLASSALNFLAKSSPCK